MQYNTIIEYQHVASRTEYTGTYLDISQSEP